MFEEIVVGRVSAKNQQSQCVLEKLICGWTTCCWWVLGVTTNPPGVWFYVEVKFGEAETKIRCVVSEKLKMEQ